MVRSAVLALVATVGVAGLGVVVAWSGSPAGLPREITTDEGGRCTRPNAWLNATAWRGSDSGSC